MNDTHPRDPRYQHQSLLVRLWRRRHQLRVPWDACRFWLKWHREEPRGEGFDFDTCWGIALGESHARMDWVYTHEEVFGE